MLYKQLKFCKLCQKPIFRNGVEVKRSWGLFLRKAGIFHKHCAYKYIDKKVGEYNKIK